MSAANVSPYLELSALVPLEHLRFATRHRIEGSYSGRHRSRQQGGAGEFVDFREYAPGEDLRRLDWKVLARTGRAYLKVHEDETNLRCLLALDCSGSMRFGAASAKDFAGSKLRYAQYLATALSYVIARGQDEVGLALLRSDLAELEPPGARPGHVTRVQELIQRAETNPTITMAAGLRQLFERTKGRGVLMLLSDFLCEDLDEVFATLRQFRRRGWEVILLHLVHPQEETLPQGIAFRFVGLEDDGVVPCSPDEVRSDYADAVQAHLQTVRTFALAAGCDYRLVSTAVPYMSVLRGFLVERAG